MNKKAIGALELIFTLFTLIVVVVVVVNMFIRTMKTTKIEEPLKDWEEVNKFQIARSRCNSICEGVKTNPGDLHAITEYCSMKAGVDLNGDGKINDPGVGRVVASVPLCEDGVYCFHIHECFTGDERLNAHFCRVKLCQFYTDFQGYDERMAGDAVKKAVHFGKCPITDPKLQIILGGKKVDPSFWWKEADYDEGCAW